MTFTGLPRPEAEKRFHQLAGEQLVVEHLRDLGFRVYWEPEDRRRDYIEALSEKENWLVLVRAGPDGEPPPEVDPMEAEDLACRAALLPGFTAFSARLRVSDEGTRADDIKWTNISRRHGP